MLVKDLVIRTGGPIDVLMFYYACSCCVEPIGVDFFEMGSIVH